MFNSILPEPNEERIPRWYFGGCAATLAQVVIHPIDVIKVGLQTEQILEKISTGRYISYLIRSQGIIGLYNGLFSSMKTQMIYSLTRFGIHQRVKQHFGVKELPLWHELALMSFSGAVGGFLRNPFEIVNVRMQTDVKISPQRRYNYKSIYQGLKFIYLVDGYKALFSGTTLTVLRAVALTSGQIGFYIHTKSFLKDNYDFPESPQTYLIASAIAGFMATVLCQPIDVIKVRYMSRTEEYGGDITKVIKKQFKLGAKGFFRGTFLNFLKIELQTIVTFMLLENMRVYYGFTPRPCTEIDDDIQINLGECIRASAPKLPDIVLPNTSILPKFARSWNYLKRIGGKLYRLAFPTPEILQEEEVEEEGHEEDTEKSEDISSDKLDKKDSESEEDEQIRRHLYR